MYKIICLLGKAGSGKDTILKHIIQKNSNFYEIISCTTRPPRETEIDGVNYHFLSEEDFLRQISNNEMIEYTEFRKWYYGTSFNNLDENKINIGVYNISGLKLLLKNKNVQVLPIYIDCSDKERLLRQLNREKNPDVKEIIRRYGTDEKDFEEIEKLVSIKVNNDGPINDTIIDIMTNISSWTNQFN